MQIRGIIYTLFFTLTLQAESFGLADLCKKGLENNPRISSFSYQTSASGSRYDQSIDKYKPQLSFSGQYDRQKYTFSSGSLYNGTAYNYKFMMSQPIYSGRLLNAITDAEARKKLAAMQEEDEKAKLVVQILQVSVELSRLKQTIGILEKKVSVLRKAHDNIKKKHAVKLAPQADKFQSLSMLQQAKSELLNAKQNYNYNLYNLRLLTKYQDVEKYLTTIGFYLPAVEKAFQEIKLAKLKAGIEENTRVKLDKQGMKIAQIQIGLRDSEWHPELSAVLSYNDSGGSIDNVTREDESHAMLSVSFPFYQGGYVRDRVEEAKYLFLSARDEAENSRQSMMISLEKAVQNIKGGIESVKAGQLAVDASKKYFEGASISYQNGILSLTDAYLAEADYRDNQLRLINDKASVFSSLVEIYYYIGRTNYVGVKKLQEKFFR
jgi:outer membrane protein